MSGTLTIYNGSNRTVKVISKSTGNEETFVIPSNSNYQLVLEEDCKIRITNDTVNNANCRLSTDETPNINMKVLKMSNSETDVNHRFSSNRWLKEFNHNVRSNWDNVTDMSYMFFNCTNLTSITLPNELPNVTDMRWMFSACSNLTTVTLPDELPSVTSVSEMFNSCTNLTSVTLPNELPNVPNMYRMFQSCTNLTSVTLPNELPNVTDMRQMFNGCRSFNQDLSNVKFKSDVNRGSGTTAYDYNTPKWITANKPKFVL